MNHFGIFWSKKKKTNIFSFLFKPFATYISQNHGHTTFFSSSKIADTLIKNMKPKKNKIDQKLECLI